MINRMKITILSAFLLALSIAGLFSQIPVLNASVNVSIESAALNRSAFDYLVSTLWNSRQGAFKTSPRTEPYNYWIDDQAKILNLLTLDYSGVYVNQTASQWGDAISSYIASQTMTNTGYVLRRTLSPLVPFASGGGVHNFLVGNNLFDMRGDLTVSRNFTNSIVYDPQGKTIAYIQGHVLYYNGTNHDLSIAQQPTAAQIIISGRTIDLRQTWAYPDFKLNIDYCLQADRPYLLIKYTLTANKFLEGPPKFVVPLDQLDLIGQTVSPGGPHIGYGWFWAPGYADQRGNDDATPQHLLGGTDTPVAKWNQTWYMVHIHDKFDGTTNSFAIIVDWGSNKTGLVAVDNQLHGSAIPTSRINDTLHYLRQYYQLSTNMTAGSTASFEVKYYFLAAHDWKNLAPVYQEVMSRNLNNTDLSSTYEYGVIVYGLAKLYQANGLVDDYKLARRIENYWYTTFTSTGPLPARNGTYAQSIGFMIRAEILLARIGLTSDRTTFAAHAANVMNELLNMQDTTPTDQNFGMVRERRFESLNDTSTYGNSYLDFQAIALSAMSEYLSYTGDNATIRSRIALLTNHLFLTITTAHYGIVNYNTKTQNESIQIIGPGRVASWLNTSANFIDADVATYKNALLLDAFTHPYSIGYSNSTFTLRELEYLWMNSALTPSAIAYVEWSGRNETNTETTPWGIWGWREWIDSMLNATNGHAAFLYAQPYRYPNRLVDIAWIHNSDCQFQLKYIVNASGTLNLILLADSQPWILSQTPQPKGSPKWSWNPANHTLNVIAPAMSPPSLVTLNISWQAATDSTNALMTGISDESQFGSRLRAIYDSL